LTRSAAGTRRHAATSRRSPSPESQRDLFGLAVAIPVLGLLVWAYWPILSMLVIEWGRDQDYSVGQLVPFVALYLLWHERHAVRKCKIKPCWWGIGVILLAQAARLFGLLFLFESAERYSMVLTFIGLVLLIYGWDVFRKTQWILLFLFLMIPLPGRIHNLISGPLQGIATAGAVVLLELFGTTVVREGNVIMLNDSQPLAVAEACSGLRMLTAFVVVAATLAYVVNRPRWQKGIVVASSIPVAIICNLARLFVTAQLYLVASSDTAERFFHDFAGLSMMPLAVLILAGELVLLSKLVIPEGTHQPAGRRPGSAASKNAKPSR
jgi:exosortase